MKRLTMNFLDRMCAWMVRRHVPSSVINRVSYLRMKLSASICRAS